MNKQQARQYSTQKWGYKRRWCALSFR